MPCPQLVRNIGITGGDEAKVGYYVGLMVRTYVFNCLAHSLTLYATALSLLRHAGHDCSALESPV